MSNKKGFTLIELLAVIVILGILTSITVVSVNKIKNKQDDKNRLNVISSILTGARTCVIDGKCTDDMRVSDLIDNNYVDFDTNKYIDLLRTVERIACRGDGTNTKASGYRYSIYSSIDSKDYNDCGCEVQTSNETNDPLCSGR